MLTYWVCALLLSPATVWLALKASVADPLPETCKLPSDQPVSDTTWSALVAVRWCTPSLIVMPGARPLTLTSEASVVASASFIASPSLAMAVSWWPDSTNCTART